MEGRLKKGRGRNSKREKEKAGNSHRITPLITGQFKMIRWVSLKP